MATGRSNYLTKQAGEYLVAAELSRRGYIATTFTGNVPDYDIIAVDDCGGHVVVQVKAIAGESWQFNAKNFAEPNAISYAEHRSRSHDAVIRVYDDAGNMI